MLETKVPDGPLEQKWSHYRSTAKLVSTGNRRKLHVIIVGTGLSGSSLAASLGEMGYQVTCFCFQDTARRAHSVAAQGGVNACKNYKNDGDTVFRMFFDTIKGGDFRSREANVYRLAECSAQLIDQAVAQGVPFAREYSGYLSNRSFGGVQGITDLLCQRSDGSTVAPGRLSGFDASGGHRTGAPFYPS